MSLRPQVAPVAGPARRLIAGLLDLGCVTALWLGFTRAYLGGEEWHRALDLLAADPVGQAVQRLDPLVHGVVLCSIVIGALLESIPPCTTPGKWLLGLHAADTHGAPCSPVRAVARNGCKILSALPLGIGFAWALGRSDRRTWHDLLAGTTVRRERPGRWTGSSGPSP